MHSFLDHKYSAPIFLFILTLLVYFPSIQYQFTYDDIGQISLNPYITSNLTLLETPRIFAQPTHPGDLYRPLTIWTIKLNYLISGLDPWSYHLFNIILNGLVSLCIFKFIIIISENRSLAFLSTLLFAIHPIHIEAVANIYNRSELIIAFFGILGLTYFYRFLIDRTLLNSILFPFFLFLSFLAKESALSLVLVCPIIFLLIKAKGRNRNIKSTILGIIILIGISSIYLLLRSYVLGNNFLIQAPSESYHIENPIFHFSWTERLLPFLYILGEYLRLITLPLQLATDYSLASTYFHKILFSGLGYSAICLAIIFIITTSWLFLKKSQVTFWMLWFLITFILTTNLITPIGTFMADRLAYLPSLAIMVLLVSILKKIRFYKIFLTCYALLLLNQTVLRLPMWESNLTLFAEMRKDNSVSPKPIYNLANEHYDLGQYQASIELYKEALFLDPTFEPAAKKIIYAYLKLNNLPSFQFWSEKYLSVYPDHKEIKDLRETVNTELGIISK